MIVETLIPVFITWTHNNNVHLYMWMDAGAGSKTVPSTGENSSNGAIIEMPLQLIFLFIFLAAYGSTCSSFWVFFGISWCLNSRTTIWGLTCVFYLLLCNLFCKTCTTHFHAHFANCPIWQIVSVCESV